MLPNRSVQLSSGNWHPHGCTLNQRASDQWGNYTVTDCCHFLWGRSMWLWLQFFVQLLPIAVLEEEWRAATQGREHLSSTFSLALQKANQTLTEDYTPNAGKGQPIWDKKTRKQQGDSTLRQLFLSLRSYVSPTRFCTQNRFSVYIQISFVWKWRALCTLQMTAER